MVSLKAFREGDTVYTMYPYNYNNFYVDPDTGILCRTVETKRRRPKDPPDSYHWYGDLHFEKVILKDKSCDGCVHFFYNETNRKTGEVVRKNSHWRSDDWSCNRTPDLCIHGYPPISRTIWYVVEYAWHKPGDLKYSSSHTDPKTGEHIVTKTYYDDYERYELKRKVCNKKELKVLRNLEREVIK